LVLQITNRVDFETAPCDVSSRPWSENDDEKIVRYAEQKSLQVILEVKLLTHQEKFLKENTLSTCIIHTRTMLISLRSTLKLSSSFWISKFLLLLQNLF